MSASRSILVSLATVVIFAAGVVTGGLLVHKTTPKPNPPQGIPFLGRVEAINRATRQMSLSPDQTRRIGDILRNGREQISDYFLILEPDIQHVFRDIRQQIRAELSPAQREEFEEIMKKNRQQRPGQERHAVNSTNRPALSE